MHFARAAGTRSRRSHRRLAERALGRRPHAGADPSRARRFPRADDRVRGPRRRAAAAARADRARRRLQLRRALAGRSRMYLIRVPVAARHHPVRGPRLRPATRAARPERDRRPRRAGRGDVRRPADPRRPAPTGRWAYTLYVGGNEHPFVHALDTGRGDRGLHRPRRARRRSRHGGAAARVGAPTAVDADGDPPRRARRPGRHSSSFEVSDAPAGDAPRAACGRRRRRLIGGDLGDRRRRGAAGRS